MWPGDPTWRFSSPRGWHSSWKTHSWGNFAFQAGSLGRAWRTHGHVPCCDSISGNNVTAARNLRPVDGNETFSSGQVCVWARIIRGGNLSRFADLAKPTPSMLLSLSSSLLNLVTPSYHPRMALDSPPHCFATWHNSIGVVLWTAASSFYFMACCDLKTIYPHAFQLLCSSLSCSPQFVPTWCWIKNNFDFITRK